MTLSFDATTHAYQAAGQPLLSVTTVIKAAGLMGDTSFFTDEARDRGTAVHWLTEQWDQGTLDEGLVDEALRPYLDAYRQFLADHRPAWTLIEAPRHDAALRYAGTIDRAGTLGADGRPTVLDIKSGAHAAWHSLQLSAYKRLVAAELPGVIRRRVLYLNDHGGYHLQELPVDDRQDWAVFQAALTVAWWQKGQR